MKKNSQNRWSADWDDFQAGHNDEQTTPHELYESFVKFRENFELLPKAELVKRGWIGSSTDITALSSYFDDFRKEDGNRLFRKSKTSNDVLVSIWISKIKHEAELRFLSRETPEFSSINKEFLRKVALMSVEIENLKTLQDTLLSEGIILVYLKALPRMKLDGAVFTLSSGNPVVAMSLRYSRLDYFWFTLMHELAHIALHFDQLDTPIIDNVEELEDTAVEAAANRLAKTSFVSRVRWRNCQPKYSKSPSAIENFARNEGIHPSIVAGLIRHESGDFSSYSKYVNEVDVRKILGHD